MNSLAEMRMSEARRVQNFQKKIKFQDPSFRNWELTLKFIYLMFKRKILSLKALCLSNLTQ